MATIYDDIFWENYPSLQGKLKPICCQRCKDNDYCIGECETCLKNRAYNREYLETHLFITDKYYRPYHYDGHSTIKRLPLRMEGEHPYLYYGIEIEVEFDSSDVRIYDNDDGYDDDDYDDDENWKIEEILCRFSEITEGMFVYEKDGSLDNGVELISRPTSYAFWTNKDTVKKLEDGLEYLKSQGAYFEQPDTNGLHIHISNKFFDRGETKLPNRQLAYQGFDWLFQKFQPEIEALGGRKYTHFCESKASKLRKSLSENNYCLREYNVEAEIKCKMKKGGELARGDHYSAVNLSGNTLEARVFKSTTDYRQVLADIELVRNFTHAVREENIEKSLNELLHTKDNLYLDGHISRTRMACAKRGEKLDLEKMNDNEIEVVVNQ